MISRPAIPATSAPIAETVTGGPGYHRFIGRLLERLGADLAIAWDEATAGHHVRGASGRRARLPRLARPDPRRRVAQRAPAEQRGRPGRDTTRYALHVRRRDRHVPRPARRRLAGVRRRRSARRDRDHAVVAGRDRRAIPAEPGADADVARGPLAPAGGRGRGASASTRSIGSCRRPTRLEPSLPYPWHAWAELDRVPRDRRPDDPPGPFAFEARAAARRPIGYRRAPVTISHEGWALEIPGEFAERRTEEEWWGGGVGRSITLAATGHGVRWARRRSSPRSPATSAPEAIDHQAGPVVGRARINSDELRRRGRRARRLLGGRRLGRRDPHRLRRSERLAVGARHVAVARPRVSVVAAASNERHLAESTSGDGCGRSRRSKRIKRTKIGS